MSLPSHALLAADLFCGSGGFSEGLRQSGFDLVASVDHDPDALSTYRHNFPETAAIDGDLTEAAVRTRLTETVGDQRLDLLAGGPPCQAFSQMRNQCPLIDDPRNRLYRQFVRLLDELQPRAFIMENVPGLAQIEEGRIRLQIEEDLALGGDYLVSACVLNAADFGTPQSRRRLFFAGIAASGGSAPVLPAGLASIENGESDQQLAGFLADPWDPRAVTAEQALSDLLVPGDEYTGEPVSAFQLQIRDSSVRPQMHQPSRIREDTVRRLEAIPPGGNVYDLPPSLLKRCLNGQKWGPAGDGVRLSRRHFYAYRRLHPDRPAWTANTKADFAYHYAAPRGLSVREAARIQGFPDRFHFLTAPAGTRGQLPGGARHSLYRQVGNAVPPPLGAAVGEAIAGQVASAHLAA